MKPNRVALKFTAVYLCYFAVLIGISLATRNPKGATFFEMLAVVPGLLFLLCTGILSLLDAHVPYESWLNSWLFFFPVSLVVVYLFGCAMSVIMSYRDPSDPVGEDTPDWHKR